MHGQICYQLHGANTEVASVSGEAQLGDERDVDRASEKALVRECGVDAWLSYFLASVGGLKQFRKQRNKRHAPH